MHELDGLKNNIEQLKERFVDDLMTLSLFILNILVALFMYNDIKINFDSGFDWKEDGFWTFHLSIYPSIHHKI